MAIRNIRKNDDPVLRKPCRKVEKINDHILTLIKDLTDTMQQLDNCAGLSANQVGVLRAVTVIDIGEGLLQLVNPVIVESEGEIIGEEGCMSFPGVWGTVKRPERIVVEALNPSGETVHIEAEGLLCKCLCHEIDHLNGEVFVDKIIEYLD